MSVDDMRAKLLLVVLDKHAVRMKQDQVAIVHSWARRGVTEKQVGAAIGKAKAIRARDGSTEPIWLRLVDTLLEDFKPTRRKGENPPSGVQDWRANAASINRMAGELGLQIRVVEGGTRLETYPEFVARIEVELLRRGGSVTGASDGRGA